MADEAPATENKAPAVLIKPVSMLLGVVSGLGVAVLLQQYAVAPLTVPMLLGMAVLGALVFGIGVPTLVLRIYLKRGNPAPEVSD